MRSGKSLLFSILLSLFVLGGCDETGLVETTSTSSAPPLSEVSKPSGVVDSSVTLSGRDALISSIKQLDSLIKHNPHYVEWSPSYRGFYAVGMEVNLQTGEISRKERLSPREMLALLRSDLKSEAHDMSASDADLSHPSNIFYLDYYAHNFVEPSGSDDHRIIIQLVTGARDGVNIPRKIRHNADVTVKDEWGGIVQELHDYVTGTDWDTYKLTSNKIHYCNGPFFVESSGDHYITIGRWFTETIHLSSSAGNNCPWGDI